MRPLARTMTAALVAAVFFAPCLAQSPKAGGAAGPLPPVFSFKGALREARKAAPPIFALSGDFRPRSISRISSRAGSGYLGWDASAKALRLFSESGKVLGSWAMDAAFAWVSGPFVLTRGAAFTERSGDARGFAYSLYRFDDRPRPLWTTTLDCFPSDLVFARDGAVYLCGADRDDAEQAIYRIDASAKTERLLTAKKKSDFMRLVECDGAMLAFASAREKSAAALELYYLGEKAKTFAKIEAIGLPKDARCAYGYGFAFEGGFVLPIAMAAGDVALVRLEAHGGVLRAANVLRGAKGCYLPIGPDPDGSAYRYLARDDFPGSQTFFLGRYDGSAATLEKIE
jgi:hypothetical protein